MKSRKYYTVRTIPKSNRKIVERWNNNITIMWCNTNIHICFRNIRICTDIYIHYRLRYMSHHFYMVLKNICCLQNIFIFINIMNITKRNCNLLIEQRTKPVTSWKASGKGEGGGYFRYFRPKVNKILSYFPLFYKVLTPTSVSPGNSDVLRITVYDECNIKWVYPHLTH
jgi:hypothetical protein